MTGNIEEFKLDRLEFKLHDMVVTKEKIGDIYTMKHYNKSFGSEEEMFLFTSKIISERKRYVKLLPTLTVTELSKIFHEVTLLGLTPKQIQEYKVVPVYKWMLYDVYLKETEEFDSLLSLQRHVAHKYVEVYENYNDLTLYSECGNIEISG